MKIISSKRELSDISKKLVLSGKSIGFVPTMGYLHEGHKSLMERARMDNDVVIASVYVNPTQFAPGEDLDAYPRDSKADIKLMESVGVDYAFFPEDGEIYDRNHITFVEPTGEALNIMCAGSRPTHFRGVDTIVLKLFHLARPTRAYFGMKDAQQLWVLKSMVRDLDLDVEIVPCPIVRESDGLAMSSRNKYLSSSERVDALVLSKALNRAKDLIQAGEKSAQVLHGEMKNVIDSALSSEVDYIEFVDFDTLERVDVVKSGVLIALAVKIGSTRLIDNYLYEEK